MNNKREFNEDDIMKLVIQEKNFSDGFDPVLDAFQLFDSTGSGFISTKRLAEVFSVFGITELSTSELSVLMRVKQRYV